MRAGVKEHERVHLEAEHDGGARSCRARIEEHAPVLGRADLAEPIDVGREIPPPEFILAGLNQEAIGGRSAASRCDTLGSSPHPSAP